MTDFRFSLRVLWTAVTLLCVAAWAVSAPSFWSWLGAIVIWSVVGGLWGCARADDPVGHGAVAGAAAMITMVGCDWLVHVAGAFDHRGPDPYFDEGVVLEVCVMPLVACFAFAPVGLAVGVFIGFIVWWLSDVTFGRPARAERASVAESPWSRSPE